MDLHSLKPRDRVRTVDGAIAEVVKETADGRWILVRYIDSPSKPELVGTEDLCDEDELTDLIASMS
ncbi:MAG: hypothetical protein Q7T33_04870 [Dehalococcoidia bacterium]|nr:hypothetical protein [Dehalococcoidia bacterium]